MSDHHHTIECDGKGGPCRSIGVLCHARGGAEDVSCNRLIGHEGEHRAWGPGMKLVSY